MRFAVEEWTPDYGSAMRDEARAEGPQPAELAERVAGDPAPVSPPLVEVPERVLFVDGVQRIDANVFVTDADGVTRQGVCASYAAGAVLCATGRATIAAAEVRRSLIAPGEGLEPITTRYATYHPPTRALGDRTDPGRALGKLRDDLESVVAGAQSASAELVVLDGRLKRAQHQGRFVGFVKSHWTTYETDEGRGAVQRVVQALAPGQRTPVLSIDEGRRFSWYLRLPCVVRHGWAGVVRLETPADQTLEGAVALADQLCHLLPRFASVPHKDGRAPQNLVPIGGLERELRRRLGDGRLLLRGLLVAAAA